jgi:hypothetical protein
VVREKVSLERMGGLLECGEARCRIGLGQARLQATAPTNKESLHSSTTESSTGGIHNHMVDIHCFLNLLSAAMTPSLNSSCCFFGGSGTV